MQDDFRAWLTDLGEFLLSVLKQWRELVMGSFLMACVWCAQNVLGYTIPGKFNLAVAVLFLGLGAFGAWREKKDEGRKAQADFQQRLADKDRAIGQHVARIAKHEAVRRTESDIRAIEEFYASLVREGRALMGASGLPDTFNHGEMHNIRAWQKKMEARLRGEIREGRLLEYEQIPPTGAGGGIYDEGFRERRECTKLPKQVEFLQRIVDTPEAFIRPCITA